MNVKSALVRTLKRKDVQDYIINLNTEVQLYDEGVDSFGVSLFAKSPYTPLTQRIKRAKNQPVNRVTLKDTGDYYKTFKIKPLNNGDFEIDSNPELYGESLFNRWDNVEGLTDKNLELALDFIEEKLLHELLQ